MPHDQCPYVHIHFYEKEPVLGEQGFQNISQLPKHFNLFPLWGVQKESGQIPTEQALLANPKKNIFLVPFLKASFDLLERKGREGTPPHPSVANKTNRKPMWQVFSVCVGGWVWVGGAGYGRCLQVDVGVRG